MSAVLLSIVVPDLNLAGVKLATLSADPVESHTKWLNDVVVSSLSRRIQNA